MIVEVIDKLDFPCVEPKDHPPVSIHFHCPKVHQFTAQFVQVEAGQVNLIDR